MALKPTDFTLEGPWAAVSVQALGAMIGPVNLRHPDGRSVSPMYRARWHGQKDPALRDAPLLRHLQGEWLCAPYGPDRPPDALPAGWHRREPPMDDAERGWDHGWVANHPWQREPIGPDRLRLAIEPPREHVLERAEREIRLLDEAPGFEVITRLWPRRDALWPIALHPTFHWPPGGLELRPGPCRAVHSYPIDPVPGISRLQAGAQAPSICELPGRHGERIDLSQLPLRHDTEELLQIEAAQPPFILRWRPQAGQEETVDLALGWDAEPLPDLLIWISQRGRAHAPWSGRNEAVGIEPCASCFDLTRVAHPAADHPLARRRGLALHAGRPVDLSWSLRWI